MTEGVSADHVANYMLQSILKDLAFLKENNYIPSQAYQEVVAILPTRLSSSEIENKPPLPTRKSINTSNTSLPIPQPRENAPAFPKLPVRRNNEWPSPQINQQQLVSATRNILHSEPEKASAAPPAYSQKPNGPTSLATAEALYDYHGEDPSTDLSFKQGNIIEVTEYVNDDWWKGTVDGKSGIFPQNHVKKVAPAIKPKRPWVPPASAKPSFSTSSNTSSYNSNTQPSQIQYNQPYSYPAPPTALYQAPPSQPPIQSYGQPSTVTVSQPVESEGGSKGSEMGKKIGGKVAESALWGFGATLGSKAAGAIF